VRAIGRTGSGVRGISLANNDEVVGMICVENESEDVMVVSEKGFGKRSKITDYRITNRGGKGVKTINVTDKTGALVAIKSVTDDDDLMIITEKGITIRMAINSVRMMGRAAQGVKLINLRDGDKIASVARVSKNEEEENTDIENEGGSETEETTTNE
jgi:DNA gyrase subunit A